MFKTQSYLFINPSPQNGKVKKSEKPTKKPTPKEPSDSSSSDSESEEKATVQNASSSKVYAARFAFVLDY